MMKRDIRIAAVVCRCPVGSTARNLERVRHWVLRAKKRGAHLVCFPEMNLTGYSNRREITTHAIDARGPEIGTLIHLARNQEIALLVGFAEKTGDGSLYASHMVITPQGRTGIYRKLHLAPPEVEYFCAGTHLPVFHWSGIRFGIQLCYDAHFPELSTRMAEAHADVIFLPHASPRGQAADKHQSWMRHLPARAFDNALFIVACNQTGDNTNGLTFPGNAVVLSPSGEIIDTLLTGKSGMLITDLNSRQIDHVRNHRMRYFLPNRRPELYRQPIQNEDLDG
ncbi:amidohydrolase [Desulfosarcina ovata subsp. sediminis]|uniref:Amidohydrolase n=1 Tax=Desulfosarcina ovata subsp. sediminis TaxID=885957 RepID=A0A5K7ZJA1_9BACT|nr:nitrilase-related carbon-nitrogen hydrolase [Desulfosarcina ovata]BBO82222.1 amidohydrolase [Desulfosarcina ovata subsp. sediminis]